MAEAPTDSPALDRELLRRECVAWTRHLLGVAPSPAVLERYVDAHRLGVVETPGSSGAFDRALVRLARGGGLSARLCDVHGRLFRPAGLLRRKLVLTLALLEVDAAAHAHVDESRGSSALGVLAGLAGRAVLFGLLLLLGLFVFLPLRLLCAFSASPADPPPRKGAA